MNSTIVEIPKWCLSLLNQVFEVERKLRHHGDPANALRNVEKIKDALEENGLYYEDPMGQQYKETRADLEATISGRGTDNLAVVEVLKPIIRIGPRSMSRVVQKGIVIVESKQ